MRYPENALYIFPSCNLKEVRIPGLLVRGILYMSPPWHPNLELILCPPSCGLDVATSGLVAFLWWWSSNPSHKRFWKKGRPYSDGICKDHYYFSRMTVKQEIQLCIRSSISFHFSPVTHRATFSFRAQCCANKSNGNFVICQNREQYLAFQSNTLNSSVQPGFNF